MAARGLPTPAHGHAGRGAFRDVYAPAEDTFLLLDALEAAAAEFTRCEWWVPVGPRRASRWRRPGVPEGPEARSGGQVTRKPSPRSRKQERGRRGSRCRYRSCERSARPFRGAFPHRPHQTRLPRGSATRPGSGAGAADLPGSPAAPGPKQESGAMPGSGIGVRSGIHVPSLHDRPPGSVPVH